MVKKTTYKDPKTGRFAKQQSTEQPTGNEGNGKPLYRALNDAVLNATTSRDELFRRVMDLDPRRNINEECGYPETSSLSADKYRELYDRESIATRVVEILPKETWQTQPEVIEDDDPAVSTEFEKKWQDLSKTLRGGWFSNEVGSPIWEYLVRADILSGIGHYGIILLGLNDGKDLSEPVKHSDNMELTFIRVFDETLAKVSAYETDPTNKRFDQPTSYSVTFNDPKTIIEGGQGTTTTRNVHWSRVVHLADNLGSSEVFGVPRLRPVYNRQYDLRKVIAGSGEMYWRGAFPGLSLESIPEYAGQLETSADSIKTQMENYMNSLQRYIGVEGMKINSLAPQVVDPSKQVDVYITATCILIGCPKRIFMGSERGELASGQDAESWNGRIVERQNGYVTPRVIVPFVDRLIEIGVLPEPKDDYKVLWPSRSEIKPMEQAQIFEQRMKGFAVAIQGGVDNLIPPMTLLTKEAGYTDEEAEVTLEAAIEHIDDKLSDGTAVGVQPEPKEDDEPEDIVEEE